MSVAPTHRIWRIAFGRSLRIGLSMLWLAVALAVPAEERKTEHSSSVTIKRDDTTATIRGSERTTSEAVAPHVEATDNGYRGEASRSVEAGQSRSAELSNAGANELGGTQLQNGQTVNSGNVGVQSQGTLDVGVGTVTHDVSAGASHNVQVGDNGVQAEVQAGLAAHLEAASDELAVGNEDVGASASIQAQVEALVGAQAVVGAYIDDKGITIGAEAKAGAFVSARAQLDFEAHLFGLTTNVTAYAEGHAGAMAAGEAVVTIGLDGKIKFKVGGGIAFGLGGSVGIEFELDASELMARLGLDSLLELIDWVEQFVDDPEATLKALLDEAVDALAKEVTERAFDAIDNLLGNLLGQDPGGAADISGGDGAADAAADSAGSILPPLTDRADSVTQPQAGSGASTPASRSAGDKYERHKQYEKWSK